MYTGLDIFHKRSGVGGDVSMAFGHIICQHKPGFVLRQQSKTDCLYTDQYLLIDDYAHRTHDFFALNTVEELSSAVTVVSLHLQYLTS